jgi:hypothetical protein
MGRRAVLAHPEKTPASRATVDTDAISLIASDATVVQLRNDARVRMHERDVGEIFASGSCS